MGIAFRHNHQVDLREYKKHVIIIIESEQLPHLDLRTPNNQLNLFSRTPLIDCTDGSTICICHPGECGRKYMWVVHESTANRLEIYYNDTFSYL